MSANAIFSTIDKTPLRRMVLGLLCLFSAGLLASSIYRAATFPFTHDESLSFIGLTFQSVWAVSSNSHLLNTLLMWCCSTLFGNSELSLRLPNVAAHALYLTCAFLFIRRFRPATLMLAGFAILNLNPFVLDFFSLARGYGLALGFLMLSLYLLTLAHRKKQCGFEKYLYLSIIAAALSVLANFSFLNCFLPLLPISAWYLFTDASLKRFDRSRLFGGFVLFSASGIFLIIVLDRIFDLQMGGAFYFGGHEGFIRDTVGSIVRCSLYGVADSGPTESVISATIAATFGAMSLLGIFQALTKKPTPLYISFLFMLSLATCLTLAQHHFLHALFPIERAATYYIILFAVTLLSALDSLAERSCETWPGVTAMALSSITAALFSWHFFLCFQLDTNYNWAYDRHNKAILDLIRDDHDRHFAGKTVKLGISWALEPSLNFYRITHAYAWLAPLTRAAIANGDGYDYIYGNESDLVSVPADRYTRLVSYSDTHTVLLRRER